MPELGSRPGSLPTGPRPCSLLENREGKEVPMRTHTFLRRLEKVKRQHVLFVTLLPLCSPSPALLSLFHGTAFPVLLYSTPSLGILWELSSISVLPIRILIGPIESTWSLVGPIRILPWDAFGTGNGDRWVVSFWSGTEYVLETGWEQQKWCVGSGGWGGRERERDRDKDREREREVVTFWNTSIPRGFPAFPQIAGSS